MPLVAWKLKQLQDVPSYSISSDPEVWNVLQGFNEAVTHLEMQLVGVLPGKNDERRAKLRKAMRSLTEGEQLRLAVRALDQYKPTSTFYFQAFDATVASLWCPIFFMLATILVEII